MTDTIRRRGKRTIRRLLKAIFTKYKPSGIIDDLSIPYSDIKVEEIDVDQINNTNPSPQVIYIEKGQVNTDNSASDCFLSQDGKLIDSICFTYQDSKHTSVSANNIFCRYPKSKPQKLVLGNVFSLLSGGGAYINYYHWLFNALPRLKIFQLSQHSIDINFYLVPNYFNHQFKKDSLEYFGIKEHQVIDSYTFPNVSTSGYIAATTHPNQSPVQNWVCEFLRDTLLPKTNRTYSNNKYVYISRAKAQIRRISNELELTRQLEKIDFKTVFLEELSLKEQINLFSEVDIVVSPHGAGLANLVFCKPNTTVIEMFPYNSHSGMYKAIADRVNLNHITLHGCNIDELESS